MHQPFVVGIAGGSGSGKTTLAWGLRALTEEVGSVLISQDDYYFGLREDQSADRYNFDEPAALDLEALANDLAELKAGRSAQTPVYDFTGHRRSNVVRRVDPVPLIIVEGLFLYAFRPLWDVFDLRYFVDVPEEERLRRRLRRDRMERGRGTEGILDQWNQVVEPMYLRHVLPTRARADRILSFPHPDDLAYCEQVVAMWNTIESCSGRPGPGV